MLPDDVRALARLLPEVIEGAHRGHPDFRVGGKILATLWTEEDRVVVKLTPEWQALMTEAQPDVFEPIAGSWDARGWTNVDLNSADEDTLRHALLSAWRTVAPRRLVAAFEPSA
ncbi:MmcQ/YjbR family DNA-binding protein [uncultured Enterovirga sp.]|uniref:MmcQ/YjbR family DNA-binding protein n=1 Tax=uncultured Enterovirga sp. TaxID=2026352 RepID=UPI0035CABD07